MRRVRPLKRSISVCVWSSLFQICCQTNLGWWTKQLESKRKPADAPQNAPLPLLLKLINQGNKPIYRTWEGCNTNKATTTLLIKCFRFVGFSIIKYAVCVLTIYIPSGVKAAEASGTQHDYVKSNLEDVHPPTPHLHTHASTPAKLWKMHAMLSITVFRAQAWFV